MWVFFLCFLITQKKYSFNIKSLKKIDIYTIIVVSAPIMGIREPKGE